MSIIIVFYFPRHIFCSAFMGRRVLLQSISKLQHNIQAKCSNNNTCVKKDLLRMTN